MRVVGHPAEDGQRRLPVERRLTGDGLVQHHAQAEQVGPVVHVVAAGLLRGHVQRGAGDEPGLRQFQILGRAGQAEVGQFDAIRAGFQQDVARLHVAVDEPGGVGGGQPGGGLRADPHGLRHGQLLHPPQPLFQGLAGHQLHDQERQPGLRVLIDLVNGDDVLAGHGGGGAGLPAEPLAGGVVAGQLRVEDLQRHVPLQHRVEGVQDDAHAAPPDHPVHLEPAQPPDAAGGGAAGQEVEF